MILPGKDVPPDIRVEKYLLAANSETALLVDL